MMKIKTLAELTTPDRRSLRFTPRGLSMDGTLKPEDAAEFQQKVIANCDLIPAVPDGTRNSFERLRTLHSFGVICYEAFTVSEDLSWLVMEQAFRDRFVTFYNGSISFVHSRTGEEKVLAAITFADVYDAVSRKGSFCKNWKLKIRSTGELMEFRGSLSQLLTWARSEGLTHGQRNKRMDSIHTKMRNLVAHPSYRLTGPVGSARAIQNLAEIINRLWGQATPGGRLYPAPLSREAMVVAWSEVDYVFRKELMGSNQLVDFHKSGTWNCIVLRAVPQDELWDFDAQFEKTKFPCDLLWGPGGTNDALVWLEAESPPDDAVEYLDRLFAFQLLDGKVSPPRRIEVALSLPVDRADGDWFVIRADFPNDALAYVHKIQPGALVDNPDSFDDGVEIEFQGPWQGLVDKFGKDFKIGEFAKLSDIRVPPFSEGAPKIEPR
jgi:hypothetical protein